jgi:hypothetical protein
MVLRVCRLITASSTNTFRSITLIVMQKVRKSKFIFGNLLINVWLCKRIVFNQKAKVYYVIDKNTPQSKGDNCNGA